MKIKLFKYLFYFAANDYTEHITSKYLNENESNF